MSSRRPLARETRAIVSATDAAPAQHPISLPIWQTTTFRIDARLNAAMAAGDYRSEYLYTRMGNPTVRALERRLAGLHGCEDGVCTASGMGAISAFFLGVVAPGERVLVSSRLYGVTDAFLDGYVAPAGRVVERVDVMDTEALERRLGEGGATWLYLETLANPLLDAPDLPAILARARSCGVGVCVDNTFANPMICRPVELGAELVIESLSKSIAGHSDVHGGFVGGSAERCARLWHAMIHLGACLDPSAAERIWRGLKTLGMRTDVAGANAQALAGWLGEQEEVTRVYAVEGERPWLDGGGGMLSFVLRGGDERALRFLDALGLVEAATSLGGVESLASLPFNTSHRQPESRERIGLLPGTVRLSVGCEAAEDLMADLAQALEASR